MDEVSITVSESHSLQIPTGIKYRTLQRWLIYLLHARTCKQQRRRCPNRNCATVQKLWIHMNTCVQPQCKYPRCRRTRSLLSHCRNCKDLRCPVCLPTKNYLEQLLVARALAGLKLESSTVDKALVSNGSVQASDRAVSGALHCADTSDNLNLREDIVFNTLRKHAPSPGDDASKAKNMDVSRGLEEGIFKMAVSKEEDYLSDSSRLTNLRQLNYYNQRHAGSSSVGTMIRTPGFPHAEGNPNLVATPSAGASVGPMDHDVSKVREYMRTLVFSELQKRNPRPADDALKAKYLDVARRLEEGIYQRATTKEDYVNPSTLASRLASLIKGREWNKNNQMQQNGNSSQPGTIITSAPQVSAETTNPPWSVQEREKVTDNGNQLETEIAEILKSLRL